jgi:hypothetical protein
MTTKIAHTCPCGATVKIAVYSEDGAIVPETSCVCGRKAGGYIGYHDGPETAARVYEALFARHDASTPNPVCAVATTLLRATDRNPSRLMTSTLRASNFRNGDVMGHHSSIWMIPTLEAFEAVS